MGGDRRRPRLSRRPALTADRFVSDPFVASTPAPGFIGLATLFPPSPTATSNSSAAATQQLKIRGFRIEPGEVGAALASHPEVRPRRGRRRSIRSGNTQLVAYYAPPDKRVCSPEALRAASSAPSFPGHMVPAFFVALPLCPLTPNGKVDRSHLAGAAARECGDGR